MSLLLVDDHPEPRREARAALERILQHPTILEFEDPDEALVTFASRPDIDLIVTDIVMPGTDGLQLAQQALEHRVVPIVFHTGSWSRDYLYQLAFNGAFNDLPIDVAQKRYFFADDTTYRTQLKAAIDHSRSKVPNRIDPSVFATIRERLRGQPDHLVQYVAQVYDELVTNIALAAQRLPKGTILDRDLEAITRTAASLAKPEGRTDLFLHNARYVVDALAVVCYQYGNKPEAAPLTQLVLKLTEIHRYLSAAQERYRVSAIPAIEHGRALTTAQRQPLPARPVPVKLENRIVTLDDTGTPFTVVKPGDDPIIHARDLQFVIDITGKAIARSMHRAEDGAVPLAGFFDSIPFDAPNQGVDAITHIRAGCSASGLLAEFCLYRGFTPPDATGMYVLVEPFHDTKYVGAALEHPHDPELVLIEFHVRNDPSTGAKYFAAYNLKSGEIKECVLPEDCGLLSIPEVAERIASRLAENKAKLKAHHVDTETHAYQMEFGFSPEESKIYDFQMRVFKQRQAPASFGIANPLDSEAVFGITPPEGIEVVVSATREPEHLSLLAQRTHEDGRAVAHMPPYNSGPHLPAYCDNLGLLILGKSLAIQEHGYFNAMMAARNVLALDQAQLTALALHPGEVINYRSNGKQAEIARMDLTEGMKYTVRDMLNR